MMPAKVSQPERLPSMVSDVAQPPSVGLRPTVRTVVVGSDGDAPPFLHNDHDARWYEHPARPVKKEGERCAAAPEPRAGGVPMSTATTTTPLHERPAWAALEKHFGEIQGLHLRDLFAVDPKRGDRLAAEGAGLYLD